MTNSLHAKLLAIQGEITGIKKGSTNPFFKSQYFDINALLQALRPVLQAHKLVLVQPLEYKEKTVLTTRLIDTESGEFIESSIELPNVSDPQKIGSIITYYRRYSIQSLFLLEAVDDDGETGAGRGVVEEQERREKIKNEIESLTSLESLTDYYNKNKKDEKYIVPLLAKRKKELSTNN